METAPETEPAPTMQVNVLPDRPTAMQGVEPTNAVTAVTRSRLEATILKLDPGNPPSGVIDDITGLAAKANVAEPDPT